MPSEAGKTSAKSKDAARSGARKPAHKSRYTPPKPRSARHSPLWIPTAMFTLIFCGVSVIVTNYLDVLPGFGTRNGYLLLGIGLLVAGIGTSTQLR